MINKPLDEYAIDIIKTGCNYLRKNRKVVKKAALTGLVALTIPLVQGCSNLYINGVRVDEREHSWPVTIGLIAAGATGTYFGVQKYEIDRADAKRKEKREDFYKSLPTSSGGRINSGSGENKR